VGFSGIKRILTPPPSERSDIYTTSLSGLRRRLLTPLLPLFLGRIARTAYTSVRWILVRGVNAPLPSEAKKILSPPPPHSIQKTALFACFRFLIFHPFFQGGQLTPFASMCGRPLPRRCGILLHILHVPWSVHMSGMSVLCEYAIAAFFAYFSKVRISHKVAFSTALLTLFVFLLPISIRLRYLDHLVANRMAPSGPLWKEMW